MKVVALSTRSVVLIVVFVAACQSSFGQTNNSGAPQRDSGSSVREVKLPSFENMLATALKHNYQNDRSSWQLRVTLVSFLL